MSKMSSRAKEQIVILQKERNISKFANDGAVNLSDFENQIKAAWAARQNITEEDKLDLIWSNLAQPIRDELMCHPPQTIATAERVLVVLNSEYGDKRSISQLTCEFHGVTQRPNEDVRAFSHRLNKAFRDLVRKQVEQRVPRADDRMLRDQLISKLNNNLLRKTLRERTHQDEGITFLRIREEAIRWSEESDTVSTQAVSTDRVTGVLEALTKKVEELSKELQDMKRQQKRKRPDEVAQGQASDRGQVYSQSGDGYRGPRDGKVKKGRQQQPRRCFKCSQLGHVARNCQGNGNPM